MSCRHVILILFNMNQKQPIHKSWDLNKATVQRYGDSRLVAKSPFSKKATVYLATVTIATVANYTLPSMLIISDSFIAICIITCFLISPKIKEGKKASEMHVATQIFSSTFNHYQPLSTTFIYFCPLSTTINQFQPLPFTYIHFCPLSSTFIHIRPFQVCQLTRSLFFIC